MKNQKLKKITMVFLISIILFSVMNPVLGAINETYNKGNEVDDDDIDSKVKDSVIIDALAAFVNAVASMVESLIGKAFQGLTGTNSFPWADRILFNAIPMLDVNIFNPSPASLFKTKATEDAASKYTPLAIIVRDTYFTILTIAVAFLTIVVGIAAVRLAITSIASEKAKYKEAITNWALAIVLLFLMHNLISFMFWTNEKIVEVASSIVRDRLDQSALDLFAEATTLDNAKSLENFLKANDSLLGWSEDDKNYINQNKEVAYLLLKSGDYADAALSKAHTDTTSWTNWWSEVFTQNGTESMKILKEDIELINGGSFNFQEVSSVTSNTNSNSTAGGGVHMNYEDRTVTIDDIVSSLNENDEDIKDTTGYAFFNQHTLSARSGDVSNNTVYYYRKYANAIVRIYNKVKSGNSGDESSDNNGNTPDIMSTMGEYFKTSAYVVPYDENTQEATGWRRSKLTVQGALLYAIFVFQSLFYFFSYIKRFFYIVVLVIMAPAIVVMDFLRKAMM